jgi:hypothetical protein
MDGLRRFARNDEGATSHFREDASSEPVGETNPRRDETVFLQARKTPETGVR